MSGKIMRHSKLRVGYFAQHQSDELDVMLTPFEALRASIDQPEPKLRALWGGLVLTKPNPIQKFKNYQVARKPASYSV